MRYELSSMDRALSVLFFLIQAVLIFSGFFILVEIIADLTERGTIKKMATKGCRVGENKKFQE